jgi:hypothetical protein
MDVVDSLLINISSDINPNELLSGTRSPELNFPLSSNLNLSTDSSCYMIKRFVTLYSDLGNTERLSEQNAYLC